MMAPVAEDGATESPPPRTSNLPGHGDLPHARLLAYFFFLGFLTSFLGLLSFATEILPYGVDYNRDYRRDAEMRRKTWENGPDQSGSRCILPGAGAALLKRGRRAQRGEGRSSPRRRGDAE